MWGIVLIIVNIIFYIIEALLLLRFVLVLFSANLSGAFAKWVFANSANLIAPFKNLFPVVNVAGLQVDLTVLFVLVVYAVIGQLVISILQSILNPHSNL